MDSSLALEFAEAYHRQSTMMLDNLGIRVKVDSLSAYPLYQHEKHRKYGTNWASRLWCSRLRPWLLPDEQRAIDASWKEAQLHLRQDMLNEILRLGTEMIDA